MAKALKVVASVAAIAGLAIITGGAAVGLSFGALLSTSVAGISAGALLTASTLLTAGASLLSPKPKAPTTSPSNADRLTVSIDVRTPRKLIFGSTAMATDLRDQEWSADQSYLHRFVVSAAHRVSAIREIWFDDKQAWTSAGGVQAEFAGYLEVTPVLEGSAANAINIGPRMGSSRRFTGCAYVHFRYKLTGNGKKGESPFSSSIPTRVTIIGDGIPTYDPRLDSTVPGGSGPMRADDQSTWAWNANASRNPAIATLNYLLGWRIRNPVSGRWLLSVGKGMPPARIDLASFITAANLCDEPVAKASGGTEPRYRCDGIFSEGDDPTLVLDNLKATMNATLDDIDGRLRIMVLHNDLAVPAGALLTGDVLGAFTWQQTLPLSQSVNVVRGGYTDASSNALFQLVDFPEVRVSSPDGIERSQTVNLPLVQSASQAQRLAKQRLQRMIYGGTFTAIFQSTAWKYQKGDIIRLSFGPLGWEQKLFRIADMAIQVDGKVPMMLREEAPQIYAWDGSDVAPVLAAAPTRYDPLLWPVLAGIADVETRVAQIASDDVLSAGSEKQRAIIDWTALVDENAALVARYDALGAPADITPSRNAAVLSVSYLQDYLVSLGPIGWADQSGDTAIVASQWQAKWSAALKALGGFRAAIARGMTPAEQAALDAAQARIAALGSDAVLSAGSEKQQAIIEWSAAYNELLALNARWEALGYPADVQAAASSAFNAVINPGGLGPYLSSLGPPAWDDQSGDTVIVAATWQAKWSAALNALAEFRAAITGRKGDPGAGAVTLVAGSATTIVDRNSVSASAASNDDEWGTDAAYSREAYTGGAVCTFTLPAPAGEYIMAGLTQGDPGSNPGNSFNSITFALYRSPSNTFGVYINGDEQSGTTPYTSAAAAKCRVQFDGRYVRWYADSTLIYVFDWMGTTADPNAPANALRFRTALAGDARVEDITLSAAGAAGSDGQDGAPGYNNAAVTIYRRSASEPTRPTATVTYTFAGASVSGLNNGWTTSIPAGDDPVWASGAGVSSQGATDTIAPNEWAEPVQVFADGANGISAPNNKVVFIYRISEAAPALPSADATYTFSSKALSGLTNGWSATIPDGSGTRWVSTASALSTTDVDTIAPGEWAAVAKLAQDGAPGISPLLVTAQPAALQLQGDTTGAAVPGSLPAYIENGAARGGVPATITDVTIDAASGCTASVADDGTTIAITAISKATASVSYTVSAAGLSQQVKVGITVLRAPTSLGERGLNIGSGGTSTSYDVFGGTISIQAGSSGKIDTQLTGTYYSGGSGAIGTTRLVTKHQYRLSGGSWVDVSGTDGAGSDATRANGGPGEPPENSPGSPYGAIGHITGLTAGTYYEVRALAYYDAGVASAKPATGVGCVLIAKQVA